MLRINTVLLSISLSFISGCDGGKLGGLIGDPSFQSTTQQCVTFDPVRIVATDYQVEANAPGNEYKLYLEDTLNSLKDLRSTTVDPANPQVPSEDELNAVQFVINKSNLFLGYEIQNGVVTSATNALDFLESLIAATDENETIQTFVNAKNNVARSIAKEDSVCNYRNSAIVVREEELVDNNPSLINLKSFFNAQLDINYNPFNSGDNDNVDQVILISLNEPIDGVIETNEEAQKLLRSFNGFQRTSSADFNATGISPPEVRQLTVSDPDSNETFFFDDDFDTLKLGQIVNTRFNTLCRDDDNNVTTCPETTLTRTPQHPACAGDAALQTWLQDKCPINPTSSRQRHPACPDNGGPAEEATGQDETGQVQLNHFTVVPGLDTLTDIQRLRLEADYPANEIRLYASKYAEAILRAGASLDNYDPETDVIFNPTNCEQQAVLDDLAYLERDNPDFSGVRLTLLEDPNYDVVENTDENDVVTTIEPTPVFTFQGTAIQERQ
jgi:hypothetical protein